MSLLLMLLLILKDDQSEEGQASVPKVHEQKLKICSQLWKVEFLYKCSSSCNKTSKLSNKSDLTAPSTTFVSVHAEHRQEPKTDKNLGVQKKLEQLDRRDSPSGLSLMSFPFISSFWTLGHY
jgi:hypothetical protein